jgi:hypothetical protein
LRRAGGIFLAQTRFIGYGARVGFVVVAGVVAAITTNVSYWNWFGFPTAYTASYMDMQIVGFVYSRLAAAIVKPGVAE